MKTQSNDFIFAFPVHKSEFLEAAYKPDSGMLPVFNV